MITKDIVLTGCDNCRAGAFTVQFTESQIPVLEKGASLIKSAYCARVGGDVDVTFRSRDAEGVSRLCGKAHGVVARPCGFNTTGRFVTHERATPATSNSLPSISRR